jgi:hypothetical protein
MENHTHKKTIETNITLLPKGAFEKLYTASNVDS